VADGVRVTATKMRECIWVQPKLVANLEFLEWTDTNHVRHIKFVVVDNDTDRNTATLRAKALSGTFDVTNNLHLVPN
jgi:hypothetical protein